MAVDGGYAYLATFSTKSPTRSPTFSPTYSPTAAPSYSYGFDSAFQVAATWKGSSCDGEGRYMYASATGSVYRSEDYGGSWYGVQPVSGSDQMDWACMHTSKSGQYVFAGATNYGIYSSSDYGVSWNFVLNAASGFPGTIKWIRCTDSGQFCVALFAPGK